MLQAFCPAAGITRVRIELGNREDTATVTPGVPGVLLGGDGADALTTGDAGDTVDGGPGNDRIATGAGADVVDRRRRRRRDRRRPGRRRHPRSRRPRATPSAAATGTDRVDADSFDARRGRLRGRLPHRHRPARRTAGATATDKTAPRVDVGAITLQRLGKRGVVRVVGTSSERGTLGASGYIDIAGLRLPLGNVSKPVNVPGAGAELTLKLTKSQLREAKKQLKRKRTRHRAPLGGRHRRGRQLRLQARAAHPRQRLSAQRLARSARWCCPDGVGGSHAQRQRRARFCLNSRVRTRATKRTNA